MHCVFSLSCQWEKDILIHKTRYTHPLSSNKIDSAAVFSHWNSNGEKIYSSRKKYILIHCRLSLEQQREKRYNHSPQKIYSSIAVLIEIPVGRMLYLSTKKYTQPFFSLNYQCGKINSSTQKIYSSTFFS